MWGDRVRWLQPLHTPWGSGRIEWLARIDNLADRVVAGSVIVNEANQRFFEPGAGRMVLLGLHWTQDL